MNSLHPLFLDHAWVAGTGPIAEFNAAVTTALRVGLPSLVVMGPSGVGKTAAARDLFDALASDKKVVPWQASAVDIKTRADTPRFYRTFQQAPVSHGKTPPRLAVLSDRENVINNILLSCDDLQTQRVMLFIDEAQELEYPTLVTLKETMERLSARHIHMLTLLLAEPDLAGKVRILRAKTGGNSVAQRFFASTHNYRGLQLEDLTMLTEHVDLARWPEGGPTYTEHFAPTLHRAGWRLSAQAPLLWAEFQRVASGMGVDVSSFELLPRFAVRAVRLCLSELQRDSSIAKDIHGLVARAVDSSGFADAHQLSADPVVAANSPGRPRRK